MSNRQQTNNILNAAVKEPRHARGRVVAGARGTSQSGCGIITSKPEMHRNITGLGLCGFTLSQYPLQETKGR